MKFSIKNIWEQASGTLTDWVQTLASNLPNIVGALLVIALFYGVSKIIKSFVRRGFKKSSAPHSMKILTARLAGIATIIAGVIVALGILGLQKTITASLAGAGVIGIVLGFAFQDVAANFISGAFLIFRKPFREGELVRISDHFGTVNEINLRATKIKALTGQMVYIPNKEVFESNITNYSELGVRRVDLSCGVSYGDDLQQARYVGSEAIKSLDFVDSDRGVEFFYNEYGNSSINFTLRFWIDFDVQPDFLRARSQAIETLKQAYDEKDISIPFPIRTLDFDAKGGQHLKQELSDGA